MAKFSTKFVNFEFDDNQFKEFEDKITERFDKAITEAHKEISQGVQNELESGLRYAIQNYDFYQKDGQVDNDRVQSTIGDRESTFSLIGNLVKTKNGQLINDVYFLNYGFGYIGQLAGNNVIRKLDAELVKEDWNYDIHKHGDEGWFYKKDEVYYHTHGVQGYNFEYSSIEWVDENFREIIKKALKRNGVVK